MGVPGALLHQEITRRLLGSEPLGPAIRKPSWHLFLHSISLLGARQTQAEAANAAVQAAVTACTYQFWLRKLPPAFEADTAVRESGPTLKFTGKWVCYRAGK